MTAYRGPREGHDAWQGDEFHFHLMRRVARHIGHPEHEAHIMAYMPKDELKSRLEAAGPIPREAFHEARVHQAKVNREHESYERVRKVRERLVKHPRAQTIFQRQHDLLKETHGMVSQERNLEIHAQLSQLQGEFDALHKEHEETQS